MEKRPIRKTMEDDYYRSFIQGKCDVKLLSKPDSELIISFISKKVINEHVSPANRTSVATSLYSFKHRFLPDTFYKDITDEKWENAVAGLLSSKYSNTSKNTIIAHNRQFFLWCVKNGKTRHLTENAVKSVSFLRIPKKTKTEKDFISSEEIYKMLTYPKITPKMAALIAILYWTGCRIGEALNLRWGDLEFNPPVLEVRIPPFKVNPERYVPTAEALSYVADWRNHYPTEIEGGATGDNFVFVSKYRIDGEYQQMLAPTVYVALQDLSVKSIGRKVHPHQFRASDITNKSKAGISDMTNKMIHWGHVGTNMLEVYSIPNKDMIRDEIMKASGVEDIKKEEHDMPILCPVCHKMNIGVKFCSNCGSPISREAIKEKALVDEETARINREHSAVDMLGMVAKELGIEPEVALKRIFDLLKDQK